MFWDDLTKLVSGTTLWRLDTLIAARLVPILYAVGLAAIGLWAVDHLIASFLFNFGQGLWGILEVVVFGTLWLIVLRIGCELVLVYLRANERAADAEGFARGHNTLLEEIGDALHDLADDDGDGLTPATDPAPYMGDAGAGRGTSADKDAPAKGATPRRTAKRSPPLP